MTIKKTIFHALLSAALSSLACIIYNGIYSKALEVNFTSVINAGGIIGACTFGSVLIALAHYLGFKWKGEKLIGWINILIVLLSFLSIAGVFAAKLPLDMESPELFPGLAIPMHFFPVLAYLTLVPFFKPKTVL